MNKKIITISAAVTLILGCAASSIFQPYTDTAKDYRSALAQSDNEKILQDLDKQRTSADRMLYMMERGRIEQLNGKFEDSKIDFNVVIKDFDANDKKATVSATDIGAQVAAVGTNDNAIPYEGYGYERIYTHLYQSFNYLGEKKSDEALIEIRKLNHIAVNLDKAHKDEIAAAKKEAKANKINLTELESSNFSGMNELAGKAKSSFQNAYAYYVAGVIMEASGDGNAVVSYKQALEINPKASFIKKDINRTSGSTSKSNGALVVLYEDGLVAQRQEIIIPIPVDVTKGGLGVISLAFPIYTKSSMPSTKSLTVTADSRELAKTHELSNTSVLAVKALKEKIPSMLVRQIIRGYAKYELQDKAKEKGGEFGQLMASTYNVASERADVRNWLTLPNSAQAARAEMSPGAHKLKLSNGSSTADTDVTIEAGKITILRVVDGGSRLIVQQYTM